MEKTVINRGESSKVIQIGLGRLGTHFNSYINAFLGTKVKVLTKKDNVENFIKENLDLEYVFMAVPDAELEPLIQKFSQASKVKIIHFSGFHFFEKTIGMHPLKSFSKEGLYDFSKINFVVDQPFEDEFLKSLFPNRHLISPKKKQVYHTYVSTVANAFQLLAHEIGKEFSVKTGCPADFLKEITIQSLERELSFGNASFSGPWTRGEGEHQQKIIQNIQDDNLTELNILFQNTIRRYKNEHPRI